MENIIIHTDGGSRGNPGPAGVGVFIEIGNRETDILENRIEISKYIGSATNNQAEYSAVIEALKYLEENFSGENIEAKFYLDSELVVQQLNGKYKVKNEGLKPLFYEARDLVLKLGGSVSFSHVLREKNQEADKLVNHAIDEALETK